MLKMSRCAKVRLHLTASVIAVLLGCVARAAETAPGTQVQWPRIHNPLPPDPALEAKVAALVKRMTLEQKIGQMVQPDIRDVTPADVRKYRLGSILNGGGAFPGNNKYAKVSDWVSLADQFYDASMDASDGAPAI